MDSQVLQALRNDRVVDITTTGRTSGQLRRIEISLYVVSDGFDLSWRPGRPRSCRPVVSRPDLRSRQTEPMDSELCAFRTGGGRPHRPSCRPHGRGVAVHKVADQQQLHRYVQRP